MSKRKSTPPTAAGLRAQINQLIVNEARRKNTSADLVRKQFVFALFFSRIFGGESSGWMFLGANALLVRTGYGRFTEDVDLACSKEWTNANELRDELRSRVDQVMEDPFRFAISEPQEHDRIDSYGYGGRTMEFKVMVSLGGKEFDTFKIDATTKRHVSDVAERLPIQPIIDHELLDDLSEVPVVPVENHLADKVCALYELHRGGVSTRYRDLADIVRIILDLRFTAGRLDQVLDHETGRRSIARPHAMRSPGGDWPTRYPRQAREFAGFPAEFYALDESLAVAGGCLDEVLSKKRQHGTWNPAVRQWE